MRNSDLPNFFIVGAAKAGTTTLYDSLITHPDVFLTAIKEPQFFSNDQLYNRGIEYYLREHFRNSGRYPARGEATPHYLCFEKVAARIKHDIPYENQRFIVILRDPSARAYSLYWNMVAEGVEDLSFEDALTHEFDRVADPELESTGSLRFRYFSSGLYAQQICRYLNYFPREKFLFLFFEDLVSEPQLLMNSIHEFLGLRSVANIAPRSGSNKAGQPRSRGLHRFVRQPNWLKDIVKPLIPVDLRRHLTSWLLRMNKKPLQYPPMAPDVERTLRNRFAADVEELAMLTGRSLNHWIEV